MKAYKVDTMLVREEALKYLDEFSRRRGYGILNKEDMSSWCPEIKKEWKNCYSLVYSKHKAIASKKAANLWTKVLNNGNLEKIFASYGFVLADGNVYVHDNSSTIIKAVLKVAINEIEKEIGIKGIKIRPRITAGSHNLLDWSDAHIEEEEKEQEEKEI